MAAATMYVTPAGALGKDGSNWANAMGEAEFETDLEGGSEAGDIYYVKAGTYTLDSAYNSSARAGTAVAPISIIGVKAATSAEPPTYSDWGTQAGTDIPVFTQGANSITFGNYYRILNCKFTGTNSTLCAVGTYCVLFNSIFNNTRTTAATGLHTSTYTNVVFCTFTGAGTTGCRLNAGKVIFSYFYTLAIGSLCAGGNESFLFNIFDSCTTCGVSVAAQPTVFVLNCVFNVCGIGISITSGSCHGMNNIFEGCTGNGVLATTSFNYGFWHNNHGNDTRNTDMWNGVSETLVEYMDNACSTGDPLFDAVNFNNSLAAGSPCINNALSPTLGT